jgi:hypothetical protein
MNNEQLEKIENWISGALTPNDAAAFEAELKNNPELYKQAKTVRLTQLAFQKQAQSELQEKIRQSVERQRKRDRRKWLIAVVVGMLIVTIGVLILSIPHGVTTGTGTPELPAPPSTSASDMVNTDNSGAQLFEAADQSMIIINHKERMAQLIKKEKAITITDTYFDAQRGENNKDSLLKKGWVLLNSNQPTEKIAQLLKSINGNNPYVFDILGQSYLLEGRYELAYYMFDSLARVSDQFMHYGNYKKLQCAGALYDNKKYKKIADDLLVELLKDDNPNTRSPFYQKAADIKALLSQ